MKLNNSSVYSWLFSFLALVLFVSDTLGQNTLFPVTDSRKYGYIDKAGNLKISCQFDFATDFSEGLAHIKIEGRRGFVDEKGNLTIKPQYDKVRDFSNGLAAVKVEGLWGYIDKVGKFVIAHLMFI